MAVVAAGVHGAGVLGGKVEVVLFRYREGVDVGAQGEGAPRPGAQKAGHDAVLGGAGDLEPPKSFERLADKTGRLHLVKRDLGVTMEVSPPFDHAPLRVLHQGVERYGNDGGVPPPAGSGPLCQVEYGQI